MESTSLVNRSGSGRACPKTVSDRGTRCDEGPDLAVGVLLWMVWSGAEEGEDGEHPAVLVR